MDINKVNFLNSEYDEFAGRYIPRKIKKAIKSMETIARSEGYIKITEAVKQHRIEGRMIYQCIRYSDRKRFNFMRIGPNWFVNNKDLKAWIGSGMPVVYCYNYNTNSINKKCALHNCNCSHRMNIRKGLFVCPEICKNFIE